VHWRRKQRRKRLLRILIQADLLPKDSEQRRIALMTNPYPLRAKGVLEGISLHELGRVLFHLCVRRGFQSNKKVRQKSEQENKEAEDAQKEAKSLQAVLKKEGITLGQYLVRFAAPDGDPAAHKDAQGKREWLRNHQRNDRWYHHQAFRKMYQDEFKALWAKQSACHPGKFSDELRQELWHTIFDQRRVWWPLDSIGKCELTGEDRCPTGHWLGQEFRLLLEINNLTRLDKVTGEVRPLYAEDRSKLAEALRASEYLTFGEIRMALGFGKHVTFRSFEESSRRKRLQGNTVEAALRSGTLASWYDALATPKDEVYETLVSIEKDEKKNRAYGIDEATLREKGRQWGLTPAQVEEIVRLQDSLPEGYFQYSRKVIRAILPYLREGTAVDEAVSAAGFKKPERPIMDFLPPISKVNPYLTNPRVHRALSEARKVVNLLIDKYGKPAEVVIEMAREMKQSREHRQKILDRQTELADIRTEARTELLKWNQPVNEENILRYRLWKEMMDASGGICPSPYSGTLVTQRNLCTPKVEVDHILPRSRTLNDSFSNKILCLSSENADKGNLTPCQRWGKESEEYQAILRRVSKLPFSKRRNFFAENTDIEGCISQQLNDTRITAKQAVAYLAVLGCPVRCVQGYTTAPIRRYWGLNGMLGYGSLGKNRFDHRNHAIDAIVIALTTHKHLHALSNRIENPHFDFAHPWSGFQDDVRAEMDEIAQGDKRAVSHRPARRIAAALHDDTGYGPVRDMKGDLIQGVYATRKKVQDLTGAMINDEDTIADPAIRKIIRAECVTRGLAQQPSSKKDKCWLHEDGKYYTLKAKPGRKLAEPPPLLLCKKTDPATYTPIKRVRIHIHSITAQLVHKVAGKPAKYVLPEGNHHLAIYKKPDGEWVGVPVSFFEAHRRWQPQRKMFLRTGVLKDLVVNRAPIKGATFVTWICENDIVRLTNLVTKKRELYRVVSKSVDADGRPDIWFYHHTVAALPDKKQAAGDERLRAMRDEFKETERVVRVRQWPELLEERRLEKVSVDPIGRVFPCND
jgi:CRISPR-associated endonuclease Csn1